MLELDSDDVAVSMFVCFNLCVPSYTQLTRPDIILTFVAFRTQNYEWLQQRNLKVCAIFVAYGK